MRLVLVLITLILAAPAHAGGVLVMTDRPGELGAALEVALANRRVDITRLPAPGGHLRLDRAAAAQRAAVAAGADAAIWIDLDDGTTDVCAVSSDGRYFRHAPIDEVSPRMFAAIATSLLDELLAPPELGINVDVHVNVAPTPPTVVATITPQPDVVAAAPVIAVEQPVHHDRTLFELGAMLTPFSAGVEGTVMFPLSRRWRAGIMGTVNQSFKENFQAYGGMFELRRVGMGIRRHFDFSFIGGLAAAEDERLVLAGVRFSWMWEASGTSLGLAPILIVGDRGQWGLPAIFVSLRKGFTL